MISRRVCVDAARQVAEQVGRRRVRPVHVVEAEDDGLHPRDLVEQRRDLPLQPLLRAARGVGGQPRGRRVVRRRRHDLHVPAWRERADEARQAAELLVALEAVEHLEHRQVRFAAGQPLRAAAAPDAHGVAAVLEQPHERVDQRGLADARFRRQHDEPSLAALRRARTRAAARPSRGRGRRRARLVRAPRCETVIDDKRRGDRRVVREREPVQDFAGAGPQPRVLLQHFEHRADRALAARRG